MLICLDCSIYLNFMVLTFVNSDYKSFFSLLKLQIRHICAFCMTISKKSHNKYFKKSTQMPKNVNESFLRISLIFFFTFTSQDQFKDELLFQNKSVNIWFWTLKHFQIEMKTNETVKELFDYNMKKKWKYFAVETISKEFQGFFPIKNLYWCLYVPTKSTIHTLNLNSPAKKHHTVSVLLFTKKTHDSIVTIFKCQFPWSYFFNQ